jgi:hypothetical protein
MIAFGIPSFTSTVLFFFLCIAVISYNPKERLNIILGILSLNWALFAVSGFLLHASKDLSEASFWNKWPYGFIIPSTVILLYYVIALNKLDLDWGKGLFISL